MATPRQVSVARRSIAVALTLAVGALVLPTAVAAPPTQQEVEAAQDTVEELAAQVDRAREQLDVISANVGEVAEEVLQAEDELAAIQQELNQTRHELGETQARLDEVTARLNERAHDAYIEGPGSELEFILGATSLTDLSDRVTFMNAVQQSDDDLATEVQKLADQLDAQVAHQENLQAKQAEVLADLRAKQAELREAQEQQRDIVADIEAKREEARAVAAKLGKQRREWLKEQLALSTGNGVFKVCPVDQPRSFGDGFGAPRSAGGFHLHEGVDIVAPEWTKIRAPFDGVAHTSHNTLGGNAVYVTGATGYVYNAHLVGYSDQSNGPVQAGDVIGYVGWTGDAMGGVYHDHFEYHPNVIPSNVPASAYGYSVIDDAINPYPALVEACM